MGDVVMVVVLVAAVVVLALAVKSVRTIPAHRAAIVERFGRHHRTLGPGRHLLVPLVDSVRVLVDTRDQTMSKPARAYPTRDGRAVSVGLDLGFRIMDPPAAFYGSRNYMIEMEQLVNTTLLDIFGRQVAAEFVGEEARVREWLHQVLVGQAASWGIEITSLDLGQVTVGDPT